MIKTNDFNGINFRKLKKHLKKIEEYPGNIPYIFYDHINISKRIEYLNNTDNKYEYAHIKQYRKNIPTADEQIKELLNFINNNPEFEDIIKIKE